MTKNITLSADPDLIQKAREKAHSERTTLNAAFRLWLKHYTGRQNLFDYNGFMKKLNYAQPGRKFSRDEMNER